MPSSLFSKKYLTSMEIQFILSEMAKHESVAEREIVKVALVAQYTLKDLEKEEFEDCNEIYDYVMNHAIDFKKNIFNYQALEDLANKEFGLETFVKNFMISVSEQIKESIDNVDVNAIMSKINEYAESKEVLDAKFVEGA